MGNLAINKNMDDEFDLVRMVESAYLEVFNRGGDYIPKSSEIKEEIELGYYDLIYGPECVSIVSEDFITSVLMMKKHVHKSRGDVYYDAQVKLIPNLYGDDDLEGEYLALL